MGGPGEEEGEEELTFRRLAGSHSHNGRWPWWAWLLFTAGVCWCVCMCACAIFAIWCGAEFIHELCGIRWCCELLGCWAPRKRKGKSKSGTDTEVRTGKGKKMSF